MAQNYSSSNGKKSSFLKKTAIAGLCIIAVLVMAILIFNGAQSSEEQYEKGEQYYNEGNYTEAVDCFRQAAEQGNADAQNALGYCYDNGKA